MAFSIAIFISAVPPVVSPSAKIIILLCLPALCWLSSSATNVGMSMGDSGMRISFALPLIPVYKPMYPEFRPMTSMMNNRECNDAVSRILLIASSAVLTAVSKPMVKSVP